MNGAILFFIVCLVAMTIFVLIKSFEHAYARATWMTRWCVKYSPRAEAWYGGVLSRSKKQGYRWWRSVVRVILSVADNMLSYVRGLVIHCATQTLQVAHNMKPLVKRVPVSAHLRKMHESKQQTRTMPVATEE